jgi:hypothetical protein
VNPNAEIIIENVAPQLKIQDSLNLTGREIGNYASFD